MDNQVSNFDQQNRWQNNRSDGNQQWHQDNRHLIPMPSRGRGRGGFRGRGRGRGRGAGPQFGHYQAFHYRSKNPRQQAPVEHYFKTDMLDDPWKDCTPVQVSEVTKQQAQNTRHRYRLFARLEQSDEPGIDGDEPEIVGPDGKRIKVEQESQPNNDAENPDEIQIDDSSEEEADVKPAKKKEEKNETEKEEEEEDDPYDSFTDQNLEDFDDAEIQEARQRAAPDSY